MNNRDAAGKIRARKPFSGSNFYGFAGSTTAHGRGSFTAEESAALASATYVVVSYSTPIAWAKDDGPLYVAPHRYSVTTSRHQSICRNAG